MYTYTPFGDGEGRRRMAGFQALQAVPSQKQADMSLPPITVTDHWEWEVQFSRFIAYPTNTNTNTSTTLNLRPLAPHLRNRPPRGTWISSSSTAFLQLLHHSSASDFILSLRFRHHVLEEHYLSNLHFTWPQMSCISGFPARGTRTIFGSYKDSAGEIQKFALRFSTTCETDSFVNILKEMLKDERDIQPISSDFGSQISTHAELLSSNRPSDSLCEELSNSSVQLYTPEMSLSLKDTVETYSCSQEKAHLDHLESVFAALPPSFTSMLSNCSEIKQGQTAAHAQPSATKDNDLKSQIMKCMEDSSFQDMLNRVEKIVNEMGGDLAL